MYFYPRICMVWFCIDAAVQGPALKVYIAEGLGMRTLCRNKFLEF